MMKQYILSLLIRLPKAYYFISGGKSCFPGIKDRPYKFEGFVAFLLWLNSFTNTQWIVSTYTTGEFITTFNGRYKWPVALYHRVRGWEINEDCFIEKYIKGSGQVTYYTPW